MVWKPKLLEGNGTVEPRSMDPLGRDYVRTMTHSGNCPKCFFAFPRIREAACAYFEHGFVTCSECQAQADLWDVVLNRTLALSPIAASLVALGASSTSFIREIEAGKYHEIELKAFGIPTDATVLQVGYTPHGGAGGAVFPIELH